MKSTATTLETIQKHALIDPKTVRRLRVARKLTMAQLAQKSKLSESAVRDIETKPIKRRRMLTVERIAMALEVSPLALVTVEGS